MVLSFCLRKNKNRLSHGENKGSFGWYPQSWSKLNWNFNSMFSHCLVYNLLISCGIFLLCKEATLTDSIYDQRQLCHLYLRFLCSNLATSLLNFSQFFAQVLSSSNFSLNFKPWLCIQLITPELDRKYSICPFIAYLASSHFGNVLAIHIFIFVAIYALYGRYFIAVSPLLEFIVSAS